MAYKTIHTNYGLAKLAQAEAQGITINLPEMAVGDGGGNPVEPDAIQSQLVRERYRAPVNRVYQDPTNPAKFSAELVIPASVGGFTLREVGIFDSGGSLFVVGNLPDTYKPNSGEGAFSDTVVRVDFIVSNADTIELIADPNVVIVTQQWIQNNVTAKQIIPGGTTGQVLTKETNEDGDYIWANPEVTNVIVDVLEERQTLAASQTNVTWSVVSTRGLAVYIDGVRVNKGPGADEWQDSIADPELTITLGKSYPAGTIILGVQNNPAGAVPYPLVRAQNLADVPNKAQGRTNLDVYSKAEVDAKVPPGAVMHFARTTAPSGWLKCNGAAISRTTYDALFAAIGTTFGAGDGFTTFNLPDLRGEFIRGWDDGRGVDGGRAMGSRQAGAIQSHSHTGSSADAGNHTHTGSATSDGAHTHSATTASAGSHTHTASTDGDGSHSHSGNTSTVGDHAHQMPQGHSGAGQGSLTSGSYNSTFRWTSGDDYASTTLSSYSTPTQGAGSHSHSFTTSSIGNHTHTVSVVSNGAHAHGVTVGSGGDHTHTLSINNAGTHSHAITINAAGSAETRPRNVALLACIKF